MALLASLSSRGAYLIRKLLSDRVESPADPANGFWSQPGCRLEVSSGQIVLAGVDVSGQLWIGMSALLELVERVDRILGGLGIGVALCLSLIHVSNNCLLYTSPSPRDS